MCEVGGGTIKRVTRAVTLAAVLALGVCALGGAASATAATITPTIFTDEFDTSNTGTDTGCSLREAIEEADTNGSFAEDSCTILNAFGNDIVQLGAGTYTLSLTAAEPANENASTDLDTNAAGGTFTLDGAGPGPGPGTTTINTQAGWASRVIETDSIAPVTISDLTITGGNDQSANGGGGIRAASLSTAVAITNVRVTDNDATNGGGGLRIEGSAGVLTVNDSEFSLNTSTGASGANGGGLSLESPGPHSIDDSNISGNSVTNTSAEGGGVYVLAPATLNITDTLIADNTANDSGVGTPIGGGLRYEGSGSAGTIKRTAIVGNHVTGGTSRSGGGISTAQTNLTLINDTISGNETLLAGGTGAGLHLDNSTVSLVHSTVANNLVPNTGASAIQITTTGTVSFRGSILDSPSSAPVCASGGGTLTTQDDNILGDATCAPASGNDLVAEPLLIALGKYGGPQIGAPGFLEDTLTQPPGLTSPALDHVPAGDCDDPPMDPEDQRGFPRPFDSGGAPAADCEAGSVEVYPCLGRPGGATIVGTSGNDTLNGTSSEDTIVGLDGNDVLRGFADSDRLCGGNGNDTLFGGDGDGTNLLDLNDGGDTFDGGANIPFSFPSSFGDTVNFSDLNSGVIADITSGSAAPHSDAIVPGTVETMFGTAFNDEITGDAGPNGIGGLGANDQINGLGGDDVLDGGSAGNGVDELQFAGAPGPVTTTLVETGNPNPSAAATGFGNDIHAAFESISGSSFGDNLTGDEKPNTLEGLAGADTLTGLGDADTLRGGTEADNFQAQDGIADTIDCTGGGADTGLVDSFENFIACANTDGDAVNDLLDACPTQAGTLPNGCVAPPPAATPNPACATLRAKLKKAKTKKKKKKIRRQLRRLGC